DPRFRARLDGLLKTYARRPTPLSFARRLTEKVGRAKIYLKREDLLHTGAHKINNCLGQALLVERMGKHRVVAETGAGQHGVATATVCALLSSVVGGANAIGFFHDFIAVRKVKLIGVEAGGRGERRGEHAARIRAGLPGASPGTSSDVLPCECSTTATTPSLSSGLDSRA